MTLIGTLLTALVIAREWERGTMETLMTTPVTTAEIILGKLIPYFLLGLASMALCWIIGVFYYDVPFRGSFFVLFVITALFLICALGQGLLISTIAKDQFLASQAAIVSAFLPAFMLSGFIFEISSMPKPIQALTYVFAARYFVTSLQTLFLVGNVWPLLLKCMAMMGMIGVVFYSLIALKTSSRLDA
jgi:ABC-2 type transport system permease protein